MSTSKCRKIDSSDYIIFYLADIGEKILDTISEKENEKKNVKNSELLFKLEAGKLLCSLAKVVVNWDLCTPIESKL